MWSARLRIPCFTWAQCRAFGSGLRRRVRDENSLSSCLAMSGYECRSSSSMAIAGNPSKPQGSKSKPAIERPRFGGNLARSFEPPPPPPPRSVAICAAVVTAAP